MDLSILRAGEGSTKGIRNESGGYPRPEDVHPVRVVERHNASYVVEGGGRGGREGAAGNAVTLIKNVRQDAGRELEAIIRLVVLRHIIKKGQALLGEP